VEQANGWGVNLSGGSCGFKNTKKKSLMGGIWGSGGMAAWNFRSSEIV